MRGVEMRVGVREGCQGRNRRHEDQEYIATQRDEISSRENDSRSPSPPLPCTPRGFVS